MQIQLKAVAFSFCSLYDGLHPGRPFGKKWEECKSSLKMIAQFYFMSFQKALGSCIYELRERMGLTVEQLAEQSGISGSRITAIERGEVDIKMGTLLLLTMSLDVTLPELFGCISGKLGSPKPQARGRLIAFPKLSKAQSKP